MEYKNKNWLYQKYIDEQLTIYQISNISGIPTRTIHSWLVKFNIPRRKGGIKHWSEEQKQFRREWNKEHPEINRMRGKKHSDETKLKMSLSRRGKSNANWKGGLTAIVRGIRRSSEYYQWHKAVLERDNHICQDCGITENVDAHHILSILKKPELIFDTDNGLTLCSNCHHRHTFWQKLNGGKKNGKNPHRMG